MKENSKGGDGSLVLKIMRTRTEYYCVTQETMYTLLCWKPKKKTQQPCSVDILRKILFCKTACTFSVWTLFKAPNLMAYQKKRQYSEIFFYNTYSQDFSLGSNRYQLSNSGVSGF